MFFRGLAGDAGLEEEQLEGNEGPAGGIDRERETEGGRWIEIEKMRGRG